MKPLFRAFAGIVTAAMIGAAIGLITIRQIDRALREAW